MQEIRVEENSLPWGLVFGNWGDVIVELGLYKDAIGEGNIIYVGHHKHMIDFLKSQSFIHEVRWVEPENSREYKVFQDATADTNRHKESIEKAIRWFDDLKYEQFINCSLSKLHTTLDTWGGDIAFAYDLDLPEEARTWARDIVQSLPRPIFVVQPFSINTNALVEHWPYWNELLMWFAHDSDKQFIICGAGWDASRFNGINNVIPMVNKTPTMYHVFALAELADGVISTSNSLGHFCVSQRIPAIVCCATHSNTPTSFWNKTIRAPNIKLLNHHTKLATACYVAKEQFNIWSLP